MNPATQPDSNTTRTLDPLKVRIQSIRDALAVGLIERDTPIRLALLAAIAGEHVLLIGPPGTAKSELARRLRLAFTRSAYFERLLTRFSVPEELFGPLSIKALEEDRYQRQTEGYLPTSAIAFLDEIFKANSAILNALLTLLNEREFDNGTQRVKTPLVCVVGASNELPQEEELLALYDRFLVRYHVGPVTEQGFASLLDLRGQSRAEIDPSLALTEGDLEHIHASALKVTVPSDVASLFMAMRKHCQDQKMPVSDRRWRKALFLLQVAAYTDGRTSVSVWDCWLLQHCLWHKPEEISGLLDWYTARIGEATVQDPGQLGKHLAAWEAKLKADRERGPQATDQRGNRLFTGHDGRQTTDSRSYHNHKQVEHEAKIQTKHYSERFILERMSGVGWVREQIAVAQVALAAVASDVEQSVRSHLWLDVGFIAPARSRIAQQMELLSSLDARARAVIEGFEGLPKKPSTLPPEFEKLPPSMLQALQTLATFAVREQARTGTPLEKLLAISITHDGYGRSYRGDVTLTVDTTPPANVREAIDVLRFSLTGRGTFRHVRSEHDGATFRLYFKLLREYLAIDRAPAAVGKRLDGIEALLQTDNAAEDTTESGEHILGMVQAIRYGSGDRNGDSLTERFAQFWSTAIKTASGRYSDWAALGLLTEDD